MLFPEKINLQKVADKLFTDRKTFLWTLLAALLFRLVWLISDGHNSDFDFFEHWAERIVQHGFTNIYSIKVDRFECDYPPLFLYVVAFFGYIFHGMGWDIHTHFFDTFLKLFTLLCEIAFLAYLFPKLKNRVFLLLLLFNPVTMINAYGWGQIDIIYTALVFCCFYHVFENEPWKAAIFLGISLSLKTQTLLFVPLLGMFFLISETTWSQKVKSIALFFFIFLIPNIPFLLFAPNPLASIKPHLTAAGRYDFIAVNAFNIWWGLWADYDLKFKLLFPPNDLPVMGIISRKLLAYLCFGVIYSLILFLAFIKREKDNKYALVAFLCFSYFMLLPEMHDRYLFPFFLFSAYVCSKYPKEFKYFFMLVILHSFNLLWAWGEQKYFTQYWLFELTKAAGILTFMVWIAYFIEKLKGLKALSLSNKWKKVEK